MVKQYSLILLSIISAMPAIAMERENGKPDSAVQQPVAFDSSIFARRLKEQDSLENVLGKFNAIKELTHFPYLNNDADYKAMHDNLTTLHKELKQAVNTAVESLKTDDIKAINISAGKLVPFIKRMKENYDSLQAFKQNDPAFSLTVEMMKVWLIDLQYQLKSIFINLMLTMIVSTASKDINQAKKFAGHLEKVEKLFDKSLPTLVKKEEVSIPMNSRNLEFQFPQPSISDLAKLAWHSLNPTAKTVIKVAAVAVAATSAYVGYKVIKKLWNCFR
jgi:hypothetical protein